MKISLVKPDELTEAQTKAWRGLTRSDDACASPFFAPAFTLAVAQACPHVEIAVAGQQAEYVAFFPFQRSSRRIGRPVGWKINDFQGAVIAAGVHIDADDLLRTCNLSRWHFDHVPVNQTWCSDAHVNVAESPVIDVSAGFDDYLAVKKAGDDSRLRTVMRKARKMEREIGPLRFELNCRQPAVFHTLLRWKFEQLRRIKASNVLQHDWARETVEVLRESQDPDCRGILSALFSGDHLVAAQFGICNDRVLHWWMPAYNAEFDRYSPGAVMLLHLIEACAAAGIRRVDLGKGTEPYKQHFMTGATPLAEGAVALSGWRRAQQRIAYRVAQSIRSSRWISPAAQWVKRIRRSVAGS